MKRLKYRILMIGLGTVHTMLSFLNKYARNLKYSQNGEELILIECWRRLQRIERPLTAEMASQDFSIPLWMVESGRAVEIGGADGQFCSNTALFAEHNWEVLFVETDYDLYLKSVSNWAGRHNVRHQCSRVDEHNINAFVDDRCDLLSIDTDGLDYQIFRGLKARPKIIIVEIDSSILPPSEEFNSDGGAGYWSMVTLALEKSYFVLCHTGNLVLVKQEYGELFPECKPHPLLEWELYFNRSWVK